MSYFTLAELRGDTDAANRHLRQLLREAGHDAGHRLIWSLFADDAAARRDFLYRATSDKTFLIVSRRAPVADPAVWRLKTKSYDPAPAAGRRLGFSLRINPSVSLSQPDRQPSRRVDIFQRRKIAAPGPLDMEQREALAVDWLAGKLAAHGAVLDRDYTQLTGCAPVRLDSKKGVLTAIDMDGVLTVAEPDRLRTALTEGIGHGKAYGLGLLLLRPA